MGVVNAVKVYLKLPESMPGLHTLGQRFVVALTCFASVPLLLLSFAVCKSSIVLALMPSQLMSSLHLQEACFVACFWKPAVQL